MKQVIFRQITIQHFLSVGEPLNLVYQPGISVVTGVNHDKQSRNGIGKSAVLTDALFFALYGTGLRPITKSFIPNRISGGRCAVQLEFEVINDDSTRDTYVLERAMKPSRLFLSKNGEDISRNMNKSTTEIHAIIDASPDVFRNCVIMSLNTTLPFMSQSKIDKRKFIEGILGLDCFSEMLKDVRQNILDEGKNQSSLSMSLTDKRATLSRIRAQQTQHHHNQHQKIDSLQKRAEDLMSRILALARETTNVEELTAQQVQLQQSLEKLRAQQESSNATLEYLIHRSSSLQTKCESLDKTIRKLQGGSGSCPTCKRPYTAERTEHECAESIQTMEAERDAACSEHNEYKGRVATHREVIARCKTAYANLNSKIQQLQTQIHEASMSASTIQNLDEMRNQALEDATSIALEVDQFQSLIDAAETDVKAYETQMQTVDDRISVLENVRFVVSEEGVKSFIVRQMLALFNSRLGWYLAKLNANCTCTFNEFFEETILDENGNETTYANFSAGEAKRIDLAMLFTFQDIRRLQADTTINLCVYDELFDSSLDESGVSAVVEILRERVDLYGECTYVITHRSDALAAFDNISVVHLEKKDGLTRLASYEDMT